MKREIAVGSVVTYLSLVIIGLRLPYIRSDFSEEFRAFWLFPAFVLIILLLGLGRGSSGEPRRMLAPLRRAKSWKDKIVVVGATLSGIVFMPAALAWTSIAFPALATSVFAQQPFARNFSLLAVRRDRVWLNLRLKGSRGPVNLRIRDTNVDTIGAAQEVCVIGREWPLGAIADRVSIETASCD